MFGSVPGNAKSACIFIIHDARQGSVCSHACRQELKSCNVQLPANMLMQLPWIVRYRNWMEPWTLTVQHRTGDAFTVPALKMQSLHNHSASCFLEVVSESTRPLRDHLSIMQAGTLKIWYSQECLVKPLDWCLLILPPFHEVNPLAPRYSALLRFI